MKILFTIPKSRNSYHTKISSQLNKIVSISWLQWSQLSASIITIDFREQCYAIRTMANMPWGTDSFM